MSTENGTYHGRYRVRIAAEENGIGKSVIGSLFRSTTGWHSLAGTQDAQVQ